LNKERTQRKKQWKRKEENNLGHAGKLRDTFSRRINDFEVGATIAGSPSPGVFGEPCLALQGEPCLSLATSENSPEKEIIEPK